MNTLTVGGFSRACIAVLSAAVTLTACSSHEEQQATPEPANVLGATPKKTIPVTAPPGTDRWAEWGTDVPVDAAGKVYMGICLMDLRVPTGDAQTVQNFDAATLVNDRVIGLVTGTAGAAPGSGRMGITIIPRSGNGNEVIAWNLDTLEANQLLAEEGICPT